MTTAQQLLEAQRRKDIRTIMTDALERRRATRTMVQDCCTDLGVSWGTFYVWAKALDIDVAAYHYVEING